MDLSNAHEFESDILLGIINEKLRLECSSLEELSSVYELDTSKVKDKLSDLGYEYDPLTNQFKNK